LNETKIELPNNHLQVILMKPESDD